MPEAALQLTRIRRLQILSADCSTMRDNIARVAPTEQSANFPSTKGARTINCYRLHGKQMCRQLNCYDGPRENDVNFRKDMKAFQDRLRRCIPEVDATDLDSTPAMAQQASMATIASASAVLRLPLSRRRRFTSRCSR